MQERIRLQGEKGIIPHVRVGVHTYISTGVVCVRFHLQCLTQNCKRAISICPALQIALPLQISAAYLKVGDTRFSNKLSVF